MEQTHKKRSPRATANSPPGLPDMGELLYKSVKFINISCMLIRILTLNAVYHKDVFIYLEPLLEYQLST